MLGLAIKVEKLSPTENRLMNCKPVEIFLSFLVQITSQLLKSFMYTLKLSGRREKGRMQYSWRGGRSAERLVSDLF